MSMLLSMGMIRVSSFTPVSANMFCRLTRSLPLRLAKKRNGKDSVCRKKSEVVSLVICISRWLTQRVCNALAARDSANAAAQTHKNGINHAPGSASTLST